MKDYRPNTYWYLFEDTGDIEAYLLYRNYQAKYNEEMGKDNKDDFYGREGNGNNNPGD